MIENMGKSNLSISFLEQTILQATTKEPDATAPASRMSAPTDNNLCFSTRIPTLKCYSCGELGHR